MGSLNRQQSERGVRQSVSHWRRSVMAFGAVALLMFVTACGQDLAKANFPRTTVPASASGEQFPNGQTSDPALSIATLRTIDACPLLNRETIAGLGPAQTQDGEAFDECQATITDAGGKPVKVTFRLGEPLIGLTKNASGSIAGLPQLENKEDQSTCSVAAVTAKTPELGITASATYSGGDACGAARTVLQSAIDRLHDNPQQRAQLAGSLAEIDPCTVTDKGVAISVLGGDPISGLFGLHGCEWRPKVTGPTARLLFRRMPPPAPSGTASEVDLGNGIKGVQSAPDSAAAQCAVHWTHRTINSNVSEVVSFAYNNSGVPKDSDNACGKAVELAKSAASKIPRSS